jgi:elongation of very long chain fatty acids protein 6
MATEIAEFLFYCGNLLATPFERNFRPDSAVDLASKYYSIPFSIVFLYLFGIYAGSKIMGSRKPFDLRLQLALWNGFLCVFSFIGMCRTVPYLFGFVLSQSYEQTICTAPKVSWGNGPTGFWVMLFIFSKIPELIDTVFIVLRKKPLLFLHWYHHVTVLLFCWNAFASCAGSGLYFVSMNYTVHALMYGYYCLQSLGLCPKSFPAVLITISQIAQMIVGTAICISAWYFTFSGSRSCHNDLSNLIAGAAMYGSYLYLFVDFAFARYGKPHVSKKIVKGLKSL